MYYSRDDESHFGTALAESTKYHEPRSCERGATENANGLLRQYVKKGVDLRPVSDELIKFAQSRINYRPKKCLKFKQPAVVFNQLALNWRVSLRS